MDGIILNDIVQKLLKLTDNQGKYIFESLSLSG